MAAVVLAFLSHEDQATTGGTLLPVLMAFGIPREAAVDALALTLPHFEPPAKAPGPATRWHERTEVVRRAQFLVKSAERLGKEDHNPDVERRYLAQHLDAVRARAQAAERIDQAAKRHGSLLGWEATLDTRTTSECRAAHGHTFSAFRPPTIGWPGTLHGGTCRCRAVAARPGARTVDDVVRSLLADDVIEFSRPFATSPLM